ncbi:MAG: phospholipase D-like domain-containing protein [Gemmatimonadaceae bacterium]
MTARTAGLPRTAAPRMQHRRQWRWRIIGAVLVTLLVAPLLIFALVGLPHVFRGPLVRIVMKEDATDRASALDGPAFDTALELVTGARFTAGNSVEVLLNGDEIFPRLWHDLRAARRSITVQMYYAGPGAVIDSTVRILAERARAGVPVFFLYDAFGAQTTPAPLLDTLRASGVRVAEFGPIRWYALDRANHRSHIRGIVIDAEIGYTGGFGLADKWLGGGRRRGEWRETNTRFEGPVVAQLQATFVAKWAETTGEIHEGSGLRATESAPALPQAGALAALAYSPALSGSTLAERLIAMSIASARQRLYITNSYFIPQADFVELLVRAARRGVDVRVLTNGSRSDVESTWLAGRSRYETLLAGGVRIYEYQPTTLHAKTFVADGVWTSIGTMNFDNRSFAYNSEVALVTRDAAVGAVMESVFLTDLRLSEEIHLEAFRRRSRWMRLRERGASALAGIL